MKSGLYRVTSTLRPLKGQTLVFESGAVLNGSKIVTDWVKEGSHWVSSGHTQSFSDPAWASAFKCDSDPGACVYEDLFRNDAPLQHVLSLSKLGPGKVFFDKAAAKMYVSENPSGQKMEATIVTVGIDVSAGGATIRGATIEKMGWRGIQVNTANVRIQNVEIRHVHETGLGLLGDGHTVTNTHLHSNGGIGLVASKGSNLLFEENHVEGNNYLAFGPKPTPWHEGGVKMLHTSNVIVRNNYSHDNDGDGWWFDTNNVDIVIEDNHFSHNTRYGLFYEVSYRATIRNNIFEGNGTDLSWRGSGLRIASSSDVTVEKNSFIRNHYSSLFVNQEARGSGSLGKYETKNLMVRENVFVMTEGWLGCSWGEDQLGQASANNQFKRNTYLVNNLGKNWWTWKPSGGFMSWSKWKDLGFDSEGSLSSL